MLAILSTEIINAKALDGSELIRKFASVNTLHEVEFLFHSLESLHIMVISTLSRLY